MIFNLASFFLQSKLQEKETLTTREDQDKEVSLMDDMLDQLLATSQSEISSHPEVSIEPAELSYQALRLNYYYSRLSQALGFMEDARLKAIDVKEVIEEAQNNPHVLYFAYKHTLLPHLKKEELLKKVAGDLNPSPFNIISLKAHYHLGKLYEKGDQEIKANIETALDGYQKIIQHAENFSSMQGRRRVFKSPIARRMYAKAHYRLGMLDLTGRTLKEVDFESALDHFLEASCYGHAKAQALLGLLHYLEAPEVNFKIAYHLSQSSIHTYLFPYVRKKP